jgi:hypothetical protein
MRRLAVILGLLLATWVCLGSVPSPRAESAALDLDGYVAELERISSCLPPEPLDRAAIDRLSASIPAAWNVTHAGQRFEVPTLYLAVHLALLRDKPEDQSLREEIQTRLAFMLEEARALRELAAQETTDARARLEEILKRPEFAGVHAPGWFEKLREQFTAWLGDLLDRAFGGVHGSPLLGEALVWTLLAALFAVAVVWAARTIGRSPRSLMLRLPPEETPTRGGRTWAAEALEHAARGRYRDAVRCAYWTAIHSLAERGTWQIDLTRTHREYLRLLPAHDAMGPAMKAVTHRFERVWYGGGGATESDFRDTLIHLEKLGCPLSWTPATGRS